MNEETPRQAEDSRLLAEVARGDTRAFAHLYDRLSGPLYTLCLRMIGDVAEAEDVLQEVFLSSWRRASSYDPDKGSVFGWMVMVTRGKAIDHLRARGRRLRIIAPAENGHDMEQLSATLVEDATAFPDASGLAEARDENGRVRRVLEQLPIEQCQAIEMAFFSDLSHHEISARLGEPLGTIKARIRRGLLKLRDGLRRAT